MSAAADILFPSDGQGPGAKELHSVAYLQFVLLDPGVANEHKKLLRDGLYWIDEESNDRKAKPFLTLNDTEKRGLFTKIVELEWGERWSSRMLSYIIESLLCDPVYGSNPNGVGWHWLEHVPGSPSPSTTTRYPEILSIKRT